MSRSILVGEPSHRHTQWGRTSTSGMRSSTTQGMRSSTTPTRQTTRPATQSWIPTRLTRTAGDPRALQAPIPCWPPHMRCASPWCSLQLPELGSCGLQQ